MTLAVEMARRQLDVINNFGNLQYLLNNYNEAVALDI